jgi:hypothetical protein
MRRAAIIAPALVPLGCAALVRITAWDPMLVLELVAGVLVTAWAVLFLGVIRQGRLLAHRLAPLTRRGEQGGIEYLVVQGGGVQAFALGALSPRIYLGEVLLARLTPAELQAVLLHEDHHRRTLAPLRGAALEAWLRLLRPLAPVRNALEARMADLERLADRHAIAHGVEPARLAAALVKADPDPPPAVATFSSRSDRRIASLLVAGRGDHDRAGIVLPYEWMLALLPVVAIVACQLLVLVATEV